MDLLLQLRDDGAGADLVVRDGDLVLGRSLYGSVLHSIFCHARRADPLPIDVRTRDQDPRGYWAEAPGDRFGSRLWQHTTGKLTNGMLQAVAQDARDALQWAVRSGVVRSVEADAVRFGDDEVLLTIVLERATPVQYQALWEEEAVAEAQLGAVRLQLIAR